MTAGMLTEDYVDYISWDGKTHLKKKVGSLTNSIGSHSALNKKENVNERQRVFFIFLVCGYRGNVFTTPHSCSWVLPPTTMDCSLKLYTKINLFSLWLLFSVFLIIAMIKTNHNSVNHQTKYYIHNGPLYSCRNCKECPQKN